MKKTTVLVAATLLLLVSCGPASAPNATARPYEDRGNTPDARDIANWNDYRKVDGDIGAICDRGNLIYRLNDGYRGGLAVVPNSPQCSRSLEP